MLVQTGLEVDHFAGVDRSLGERGLAADRVFPDQPPPQLTERTRVVVVTDTQASLNCLMLRQARRIGATTVLLMDGLVEYRNTFVNRRVPAQFLRPAPVDVVACAGELDQGILEDLGNRAVATGLPRLMRWAEVGPVAAGAAPALLVATANQPAFDQTERRRLVASLQRLHAAAGAAGLEVIWRLTGGLHEELGVPADARTLAEALAASTAVITTPSTLMVEAMLAGRPTALLHAQATPLWQPAALAWRGGHPAPLSGPDWRMAEAAVDGATLDLLKERHARANAKTTWVADPAELISRLVKPDADWMERQAELLGLLHVPRAAGPADRLAELIADPPRRTTTVMPALPSAVRLPRAVPKGDRPRVVSCVVCDDSTVGGVRTWSERLSAAFSQRDLGYDVRTLLIVAKPDAWRGGGGVGGVGGMGGVGGTPRPELEDLVDACVIDPCEDHVKIVRTVREALERLQPDIVLPNYTDLTYAAAAQLAPGGVRTLAIAHTDEPYYRSMIETYNVWSAAVGVSRVCTEWLRPLEEETRRGDGDARPVEQITYGVPIAAAKDVDDRLEAVARSAGSPLRLAYIGRMVQAQKRIDDLLRLVDELDGLDLGEGGAELHMVGDGPNLARWRAALATRRLKRVRVIVHGARDAAWVQAFLPTVHASVLVSEFEGTSISMLEAMGQAVAPVVTAVESGVGEWVQDHVSGVVAPIGDMRGMASRLAELAKDRAKLGSLARAAWEKARKEAGLDAMAFKYAELFDKVMKRPAEKRRTDVGLRLTEYWRWSKHWAEDYDGALAAIEAGLREAGFKRPVYDRAIQGCDAVIVRALPGAGWGGEEIAAERLRRCRERGLAVVYAPHLLEPGYAEQDRHRGDVAAEAMRRLVQTARAQGCERIAVYGAGKHTRKVATLFTHDMPLVGIIDDHPPPWEYMFGLPVVAADRAMEVLNPDAILLSSDAFEAALWDRCAEYRRAGVRVIPVYGEYEGGGAAREVA